MDADFKNLMHVMGDHVVDAEGRRIGKLTQIALEPNTYRAEWLVVKTSLFGRTRLVPIESAVEQGDTIRVPFSRDTVLNAPVPEVPLTPAPTECTALEDYYQHAA
jgi:sporulation protein YlmC with PRC-barrel domain